MCGICGTIGFASYETLRHMNDAMRHRGPDDAGVEILAGGRIGLGNRRLSIIDLTFHGHQPMSNDQLSVWITYNGEVYNFESLRSELEQRGHQFHSRTDTEVVLRAYEEWGPDCFARLNGMFAVAIADLREGASPTVILARDRYGMKPLYYVVPDGKDILFASEIKALLTSGRVKRDPDLGAIGRYMAFGYALGPETLFRGISKVPPAHYLTVNDGTISVHRYWDLAFAPAPVISEDYLADELIETLTAAVRRHLISDVDVGVFLSGGLDSSIVLALMARVKQKPLRAYTIALRPQDRSFEHGAEDVSYARMIAGHCGAEMHELTVTPDTMNLLPEVIWHLDEPVADVAAIATHLICRAAARDGTKVLLTGHGADEIFAGYRAHWVPKLESYLAAVPAGLREILMQRLLLVLPRVSGRLPGLPTGSVMGAHRYLSRILSGIGYPPEERFLLHRSIHQQQDLSRLYTAEMYEATAQEPSIARHLELFARTESAEFLHQMLYVDLNSYLAEQNLLYADKLSAANSVELRLPFLDMEVVDLMRTVPAEMKLRGFTTKYILKRAARDLLPAPILKRRKAGFGVPLQAWLDRELRTLVDDLLSPKSVRSRGYFHPAGVTELVEDYRMGRRDNSTSILALLMLELWHRIFIERTISVESTTFTSCDRC